MYTCPCSGQLGFLPTSISHYTVPKEETNMPCTLSIESIGTQSCITLLATAVILTLESLMTSLHVQYKRCQRSDGQHRFQSWEQDKASRNLQDIITELQEAEQRVKWKDKATASRSSSLQQASTHWHGELQQRIATPRSAKNVNETYAAARIMWNLTMCTINTSWKLPPWLSCGKTTFDKCSIADELQDKLQSHSFNGAVTGAVLKCFSNSDGNPQKCKLAAAAITLRDTTKDFIRTYQENKKENIRIVDGCSTTTVPDNVEQTLCDTSVRILCFLKEIYCINSIRYDGP